MRRPLAACLAVTAALAPAAAATRAPEPPAAAPAPATPPYQADVLHLAELLGTLAYMTDLCGLPDAETWRARMATLLASDGQDATSRELLAGAYNRGFRGYEATYRTCTGNAQLVISRALEEAGRLVGTLVGRFGAS